MNRTGDIIALIVGGLGCALLGWAAVHVAAQFERQRAVHILEKYGYAPSNIESLRQWRWVSLIRSAFHPTKATP
jgi:hypothetical protein